MGTSVVIKLGLQLTAFLICLSILILKLSIPVLKSVSLTNKVLNIDLQIFWLAFKLSVDLKNVNFVKLLSSELDMLPI